MRFTIHSIVLPDDEQTVGERIFRISLKAHIELTIINHVSAASMYLVDLKQYVNLYRVDGMDLRAIRIDAFDAPRQRRAARANSIESPVMPVVEANETRIPSKLPAVEHPQQLPRCYPKYAEVDETSASEFTEHEGIGGRRGTESACTGTSSATPSPDRGTDVF
ncbi:hypothetical protein N9L68_08340, partial [bacterium]|nr:hypothetical protein [bacterium]